MNCSFGVDSFFTQAQSIIFSDSAAEIFIDDAPLCSSSGGESMLIAFRRSRDQGEPFYVRTPAQQCARRYDSWDFDITGIRTQRGDRIDVDFRFSYDGFNFVDVRSLGSSIIHLTARRVYMVDDLAEAVDSLFGAPKPSKSIPKPKPKLIPRSRWAGVT